MVNLKGIEDFEMHNGITLLNNSNFKSYKRIYIQKFFFISNYRIIFYLIDMN